MLIGDVADDLLEQILDGGDAGGAPELVDHDGELLVPRLELAQQDGDLLGLRNHVGRAGDRLEVDRLSRAQRRHQIAQMEHGDDLIGRLAIERQTGVSRVQEDLEQLLGLARQGSRHHVDARRHDALDQRVAELDDALDEDLLARLENALALPDGDVRVDLALGGLLDLGRLRRVLWHRGRQERAQQSDQRTQHHHPRPVGRGQASQGDLGAARGGQPAGELRHQDDQARRGDRAPDRSAQRPCGHVHRHDAQSRDEAQEEAVDLEASLALVQGLERAPRLPRPVPQTDQTAALEQRREDRREQSQRHGEGRQDPDQERTHLRHPAPGIQQARSSLSAASISPSSVSWS